MAPDSPTSWRPTPDMAAWMRDRAERAHSTGGLGSRTRTEMVLWRSALAAELERQTWSLTELGLISEVCAHPVLPDALGIPVGLVAQDVIAATRQDPGLYEEKWGVDEQRLIGRLAQLGPVADLALYDAVSRWWAAGATHDADGWAAVGLHTRRAHPADPQPPTPAPHNG